MTKRPFPIPHYAAAVLSASLVLGILRGILFVFSFDTSVGYFNAGLLLSLYRGLTGFVLLGIFAAAGYAFFLQKKEITVSCLVPAPVSAAWRERLPQIGTGLSLVALFAARIAVVLRGDGLWAEMPVIFLALLAAPCFLFGTRKSTVPSGLIFVLLLTITLVMEYRDWFVAMNSPLKIGNQVSYVCMIGFQLADLRAYNRVSNPRYYSLYAGLATLFCLSNGTSLLIAQLPYALQGALFPALPSGYVAREILIFFFGIYACGRLFAAKLLPVVCKSDTIDGKKSASANARSAGDGSLPAASAEKEETSDGK